MRSDDAPVTDDADHASFAMSEGLRERIVSSVYKMVLWGEGREAAMHKLKVNGITGDEAAAMVERVAIVHAHYRREAIKGFGLMLPGLAGCFRLHVINPRMWFIIFLPLVFGCWHFGKGMCGMLTSRDHEGSVTDLDD